MQVVDADASTCWGSIGMSALDLREIVYILQGNHTARILESIDLYEHCVGREQDGELDSSQPWS